MLEIEQAKCYKETLGDMFLPGIKIARAKPLKTNLTFNCHLCGKDKRINYLHVVLF